MVNVQVHGSYVPYTRWWWSSAGSGRSWSEISPVASVLMTASMPQRLPSSSTNIWGDAATRAQPSAALHVHVCFVPPDAPQRLLRQKGLHSCTKKLSLRARIARKSHGNAPHAARRYKTLRRTEAEKSRFSHGTATGRLVEHHLEIAGPYLTAIYYIVL